MIRTLRALWDQPKVVVAIVIGIMVGAVPLLLVRPQSTADLSEARWFVNLFGFLIGAVVMGMSLHFYYGPELRRAGIVKRLMPAGDPPTEIVLIYFSLGAGLMFTATAIARPGFALVLFWRVIGYSIFLAVATSNYVLWMERLSTSEGES